MNLRLLASAENKVQSARRYLDEQLPGLGDRFLGDLESTFARIVGRPLAFGKLESLADSPYRRALLKRFRYTVVFETLPDEILVVAVAHTSRKQHYWLGRQA